MAGQILKEVSQIVALTPPSAVRIALFGSVTFYNNQSPLICEHLGQQLAQAQKTSGIGKICLLTGANAIVHERIASAFHEECARNLEEAQILHLSPEGYTCTFSTGRIIIAGESMEERRRLLAEAAQLAITVEGGPGTADEMRLAQINMVPIIPLIRTGGASAGMFDAPVVEMPKTANDSDWRLLQDSQCPPKESACAAVRLLQGIVKSRALF